MSEHTCSMCGSSYRLDAKYKPQTVLCPECMDEHVATLTAGEKGRGDSHLKEYRIVASQRDKLEDKTQALQKKVAGMWVELAQEKTDSNHYCNLVQIQHKALEEIAEDMASHKRYRIRNNICESQLEIRVGYTVTTALAHSTPSDTGDSVLKLPSEWEKITGIEILDPDGWRNEKKDWGERITRQDFERLLIPSTVRLPASMLKGDTVEYCGYCGGMGYKEWSDALHLFRRLCGACHATGAGEPISEWELE